MDLATFTKESGLNRQAYAQLREGIQRDFAGQYVALARGKLIGAAPTFDEARALVERLQPAPRILSGLSGEQRAGLRSGL